jgi:NAD(P)-dependent dehydrogenase (short-subunit alcohol dehydrogenase family)
MAGNLGSSRPRPTRGSADTIAAVPSPALVPLRPGLLAGHVIARAGTGDLLDAAAARLTALGASVEPLPAPNSDDPEEALGAAAEALAARKAPNAVVIDASGEGDGADAFRSGLDAAWMAARAIVSRSWIPAGHGGPIVLIGARPAHDPWVAGARAAVENLARTTSIEWARWRIRPIAVLPGAVTAPEEVADLVAYLLSDAGGYFSGCVLDLGGAAAS